MLFESARSGNAVTTSGKWVTIPGKLYISPKPSNLVRYTFIHYD